MKVERRLYWDVTGYGQRLGYTALSCLTILEDVAKIIATISLMRKIMLQLPNTKCHQDSPYLS